MENDNETKLPEGIAELVAKTKADGKTVEKAAQYEIPTIERIADVIANGTDELRQQLSEFATLGFVSRLRNYIVADRTQGRGTITMQDMLEMAAEAAASRASTSEGLAAHRELVGLIVKVAEASGMSANGCAKVRKLVTSPVGLSLASASVKAKISSLLEATAGALSDEDLARLQSPMQKLIEATQATDDADEW